MSLEIENSLNFECTTPKMVHSGDGLIYFPPDFIPSLLVLNLKFFLYSTFSQSFLFLEVPFYIRIMKPDTGFHYSNMKKNF